MHDKQYRLYRMSAQKSLNKQQQFLEKGEKLISRVAALYYLQCPVFNKAMRYVKEQESMAYLQEKKLVNTNCLSGSQMLEFTRQKLGISYFKYIQRSKRNHV